MSSAAVRAAVLLRRLRARLHRIRGDQLLQDAIAQIEDAPWSITFADGWTVSHLDGVVTTTGPDGVVYRGGSTAAALAAVLS